MAVLAIGYLFPSEFAYSLLTSETDKEDPSQKLEEALRNISDTEPNPSDPEKLKLEKEIVKTKKEIEKLVAKKTRGEKLSEKEQAEMGSKVW